MLRKMLSVGLIALGTTFTASSAMAGDAAKGKAAYAVCMSCHGVNGEGNKMLNAPALSGLQEWYLERQLKNYKSGVRGTHAKDIYGAQMRPMSMTLADDAAIANVAAYIASLPTADPKTTIQGDVAAGKVAYAVCTSCHGADAKGNKALNAPSLVGQHDWYLARQLQNYKAGIRGTHPKDTYGAQMRPMSMTLADDTAINNVVSYISTLK